MKPRKSREFNEFCSRAAGAVAAATAGLASGSSTDLRESYVSSIRLVFGILSAFLLESRDIGGLGGCCRAIGEIAIDGGKWTETCEMLADHGSTSGVDILNIPALDLPSGHAEEVILRLLASDSSPALGSVYFGTVPPGWVSMLYEYLLDRKPVLSDSGAGVVLRADSSSRKRNGAFFTPGYIVDFIVKRSLGELKDLSEARVLDPSMGAGDFLMSALRRLSSLADPAEVAENCIFGCDIDPIAVDITRFLLWMETGGRADARRIARHLICADAIAGNGRFYWDTAFPDAFGLFSGALGFDAVIGNPPYVAAKNAALGDYQAAHSVRGQSDYYLIFMQSVLSNDLVKPGGSLAMVLPDPFLVRANAARVRKSLFEKWTTRNIVHVRGAFPGAQVANIILVTTSRPSDGSAFPVLRLENTPARRGFELDPDLAESRQAVRVRPSFALAQPRTEVLYLVDKGYTKTFERIHGREMSLSKIVPPFVALDNLEIVERVFRGEEIGKRKVTTGNGELPILLGGESIRRGRIAWEGYKIARGNVKKNLEWYQNPKIVLQKSSARVVAAHDASGFVIPQSVYGISLREGHYHPLYLLAVLNSAFMSDYVFRAYTGYKMVQPQIELEDVRALPIRTIDFEANPVERTEFAAEAMDAFEDEFRGGAGGFPRLTSHVLRMLDLGHTDAVHDVLVYIAGIAYSSRDDSELIAMETERLAAAMNEIVDMLYAS